MKDEENNSERSKRTRLNWATSKPSASEDRIASTKELMDPENRMKLGQELIDSARSWNFKKFQALILDPNVPVDYVEPSSKSTILHVIANFGSVRMYDLLLKRDSELNFLTRNWKGYLSSELAAKHSDRNDLSDQLIAKELQAAKLIGATLNPRITTFADGTTDPPQSPNSPSGP